MPGEPDVRLVLDAREVVVPDLGSDRQVEPVGRDSDPDAGTAARELVYGLSYALADDVDLGLGVKRGLNDAAADLKTDGCGGEPCDLVVELVHEGAPSPSCDTIRTDSRG